MTGCGMNAALLTAALLLGGQETPTDAQCPQANKLCPSKIHYGIGPGDEEKRCVWSLDRSIDPSNPTPLFREVLEQHKRQLDLRLAKIVTLHFTETPLKQVISELHYLSGVEIALDMDRLLAAGVDLNCPVTLHVENISVKTALHLLLEQVKLVPVFQDGVVKIATRANTSKLVSVTYPVADLVMPFSYDPDQKDLDARKTREEKLIELITSTVAPETWEKAGGSATVQFFPLGMGLVVKQTPEAHEEIADLLAALRRMQKIQVALDTRIISVNEAAWDKIAKQLNIDPAELAANDMEGVRTGFVQRFLPDGFAHSPTVVLMDDQVLELLKITQQDKWANAMQAPRITVINGQRAVLNVTEAVHFPAGTDTVKDGDDLRIIHKLKGVRVGLVYSVQPIVTADRSSVRVDLNFNLSNLNSLPVIPANFEQAGAAAVQPDITTLKVQRHFQVEDGKTAVLYAGKVMTEVRQESSTPVLSKIPYVNRFFRNVGYGREAQTVLVLVTPRIIINEEEEERQEVPAAKHGYQDMPCAIPVAPAAFPTPEERNAPRTTPTPSSGKRPSVWNGPSR